MHSKIFSRGLVDLNVAKSRSQRESDEPGSEYLVVRIQTRDESRGATKVLRNEKRMSARPLRTRDEREKATWGFLEISTFSASF